MGKEQAKYFHSLPQIVSVLNIISDVFLTSVCEKCRWDEATLNYYMKNSDQIPPQDQQMINHIIQGQFNHLAKHCPRICHN